MGFRVFYSDLCPDVRLGVSLETPGGIPHLFYTDIYAAKWVASSDSMLDVKSAGIFYVDLGDKVLAGQTGAVGALSVTARLVLVNGSMGPLVLWYRWLSFNDERRLFDEMSRLLPDPFAITVYLKDGFLAIWGLSPVPKKGYVRKDMKISDGLVTDVVVTLRNLDNIRIMLGTERFLQISLRVLFEEVEPMVFSKSDVMLACDNETRHLSLKRRVASRLMRVSEFTLVVLEYGFESIGVYAPDFGKYCVAPLFNVAGFRVWVKLSMRGVLRLYEVVCLLDGFTRSEESRIVHDRKVFDTLLQGGFAGLWQAGKLFDYCLDSKNDFLDDCLGVDVKIEVLVLMRGDDKNMVGLFATLKALGKYAMYGILFVVCHHFMVRFAMIWLELQVVGVSTSLLGYSSEVRKPLVSLGITRIMVYTLDLNYGLHLFMPVAGRNLIGRDSGLCRFVCWAPVKGYCCWVIVKEAALTSFLLLNRTWWAAGIACHAPRLTNGPEPDVGFEKNEEQHGHLFLTHRGHYGGSDSGLTHVGNWKMGTMQGHKEQSNAVMAKLARQVEGVTLLKSRPVDDICKDVMVLKLLAELSDCCSIALLLGRVQFSCEGTAGGSYVDAVGQVYLYQVYGMLQVTEVIEHVVVDGYKRRNSNLLWGMFYVGRTDCSKSIVSGDFVIETYCELCGWGLYRSKAKDVVSKERDMLIEGHIVKDRKYFMLGGQAACHEVCIAWCFDGKLGSVVCTLFLLLLKDRECKSRGFQKSTWKQGRSILHIIIIGVDLYFG